MQYEGGLESISPMLDKDRPSLPTPAFQNGTAVENDNPYQFLQFLISLAQFLQISFGFLILRFGKPKQGGLKLLHEKLHIGRRDAAHNKTTTADGMGLVFFLLFFCILIQGGRKTANGP